MKSPLFLYYSNIYIYELVNDCKYFYYKDGVRNYCTSACNKDKDGIYQDKYSQAPNKKCETSCSLFHPKKDYYDPDTHECLDTCKGLVDKEFGNQIIIIEIMIFNNSYTWCIYIKFIILNIIF